MNTASRMNEERCTNETVIRHVAEGMAEVTQ